MTELKDMCLETHFNPTFKLRMLRELTETLQMLGRILGVKIWQTTRRLKIHILIIQGVSENTDTFVLSIVAMLLPVVSCNKHLKIASSMEIC